MRLRVQLPEGTSEWESDVPLFRVGRGDSCALKFEGELAKYASWEHAEFKIDETGGATVTDLGSSNGTYVEGARIAETTPLWVGATVQIGTKGPRLEVLELARPVPRPLPVVRPTTRAPTAGTAAPSPDWQKRGLAIGLAVVVLAGLALLLTRKGGAPEPAPQPIAQGDDTPNPGRKSSGASQKQNEPDPPKPPIPPVQPAPEVNPTPPVLPPPPAVTDPWKVAKQVGMAAYRLVAIEDPKTQTTWPYAGAVVVAPQTLLTTADVGVELVRQRERGMNVKILRDSQDTGVPIDADAIRIHAAYQKVSSEEQLYFDLAILPAKERLSGAASQPSAEELSAIERGQPLACATTDHSGEPIDRFQQLQPEWQMGKVFAVTRLSSEGGAPRVLHLRGAFSDKAWGSPIFNDRGQLVAVYCEPAPDDGGPPERAIHFAKLIEPQLVKLALSNSDNPIWVAPVVPPEASPQEEPAK